VNFKDTVETEERGETAIYLVTEPVAPLTNTVRALGLEGSQREQYLSMGMHQVVSAVSFLNNDCKLIHGNVCAAAIVVTESLDWKLHSFDLTTEHEWPIAMGSSIPLAAVSWMVGAQYKPGEVAKADWVSVRDGPCWAVDAWGLGCLIQEVYSGALLVRTEDLRTTESLPQPLLQFYQRLLASQPARRLNPAKIVESGVLRNKLVETTAFLENLSLKETMEKDAFFKRLPSLLPSIPESVAQRKLLPLLAAALEFGGAPPVALGTLLRIGDGMPEEDRSRQVLPILTKLFASNDRGIRRSLLENISSFGPSLPPAVIEDQIYPSVQSGFGDANPYIRELTLKSMVELGPKLSQKTLNQSLLKHLAKLQVDEEPAIRANTTVLLGNLAPLLSESTCKKVLLNAFTRALRDPFPPARVAGLKAILSTSKFHGPEEAATRVLPMVAPLCIDPVGEVRTSALQCMEYFMGELQRNSKEMTKKAETGGSVHGDVMAVGGAGTNSAGGSSLLTGFGWAVSSLVSKGSSVSEGNGARDNQARSSSMQAPARSGGADIGPSTATGDAAGIDRRDDNAQKDVLTNGNNVSNSNGNGQSEMAVPGSGPGDGWGDDNDDEPFEDMLDAMSAEMEARKKLSRVAVSRPAASVRAAPSTKKSSGIGSSSSSSSASKGMKLGARKLEDDEFVDW